MLKVMRESFHHLKWILLAVVAAFIIGFVFIDMGLGGAASGRQQDDRAYAARVNGSTISYRDFQRALYFTTENYKRMYGDRFNDEMAQAMGIQKQVLDTLVDQRLLLQEAERLHLDATQEEIRRKILTIQTLNPDGKFVGNELYTRFVQQIGFDNAADFEDDLAPYFPQLLRLKKFHAAIFEMQIAVGAPANLVLLDLKASWRVTEDVFRSRSVNSWLLGETVKGRVRATVAAGRLAYSA